MVLTILGSGTCALSSRRSSPANHLQTGETQVLVDCGPGTLAQMARAGLSYQDVDMVFITHFHIDHISDLGALVWALSWGGFGRNKDLVVYGPVGMKRFYQDCIAPLLGTMGPRTFSVIIHEICGSIECDGFQVSCCKTVHTDESVAYRFAEQNASLVISGDTDFCESLISLAAGCTLLVLECSSDASTKMRGHLTSRECGEIARRAGVQKLLLTHLYPFFSEAIRLDQARELFTSAALAEDLMKIEL